jgi:hypothetical protein
MALRSRLRQGQSVRTRAGRLWLLPVAVALALTGAPVQRASAAAPDACCPAAAPAARGETRFRPKGRLAYGPLLAGSRVVWAEEGRQGLSVVVGGRGGRRRTVFRRRRSAAGIPALTTMAASGGALVFEFVVGEGYVVSPPYGRLAGRPGGRLKSLGGCRQHGALGADGRFVLYPEERYVCQRAPGRYYAVVRNVGSGATHRLLLPPERGGPLVIAGRFIAVGALDPRAAPVPFTVWNWPRRAAVYSFPAPSGETRAFDLQPDGKAVIAYRAPSKAAGFVAEWHAPADPAPHRLPLRLSAPTVKLARDRIALAHRTVAGEELALMRLNGTTVQVAGFRGGPRGARRVGIFDFDGQRVTWAERRGRGTTTIRLRSAP